MLELPERPGSLGLRRPRQAPTFHRRPLVVVFNTHPSSGNLVFQSRACSLATTTLRVPTSGIQRAVEIGCAAGNDPAGLPKTVNSMIPSGVARGQLIIVSRTNRHLVGGISSKIVLRMTAFVL